MTPDTNDGVPAPLPPADNVAEQHILDEVAKAKLSLNRTIIFSLVSLLAVGGYMSFITVNLGAFLQPTRAAELARGLIAQRVEDQGPQIADQVKQQIPILISQLPDYALSQLPVYRQSLEDEFDKSLTTNLTSGSAQLQQNMDKYLTDNKDSVKAALASGADPAATKKLGDGITQEFLGSLKTTQVDGESIQSKFDNSLDALTSVQKTMDHLANGKNLTAQEKKTRHAIAIMTKTINREAPKMSAPAGGLTTASASDEAPAGDTTDTAPGGAPPVGRPAPMGMPAPGAMPAPGGIPGPAGRPAPVGAPTRMGMPPPPVAPGGAAPAGAPAPAGSTTP